MSTATLRKIDTSALQTLGRMAAPASERPQLRWIAIDLLRVDLAYQREIAERGRKNIYRIAREFDWAKFGTVIVSEADAGIFLIIDGQHRTTAAALRGLRDVPCQIVKIDRAHQAAAFAAINGNVTALTPVHLYHAKVAAGEAEASALAATLEEAGVSICRYPVPANKMKAGETLAAGKLPQLYRRYGAEVLRTALRCITQTRKGNPGMVRAPIADALCATLDAEPSWRADEDRLIRAMHAFDFVEAYALARRAQLEQGVTITTAFIELLTAHLEAKLT